MFKKDKILLPAQYGTIERRREISPATENNPACYETSIKQVLLRQAQEIERGIFFHKIPIYETQSEKIYLSDLVSINPDTGQYVVGQVKYKTVTKRVVVGHKSVFAWKSPFKGPAINEPIKKKRTFDIQSVSVSTLNFFLPKEIRQEVIGDILEDYHQQKSLLGRASSIWLVKEVTFTLLNVFIDWFVEKIPTNFNINN